VHALVVATIAFRGLVSVDDASVRRRISLAPGATFSQEQLAADVRALWASGDFDDIRVEKEASPTRVALTFVLHERPRIRAVSASGNTAFLTDELRAAFALKPGDRYDPARADAGVRAVRDTYVRGGYAWADVTPVVRAADRGGVTIELRVTEGARADSRLAFTGDLALPESELRAALDRDAAWYDEDTRDRQVLLVLARYFDHGYVNARIDPPLLTPSADRRFYHVTIHCTAGPQFTVATVDLTGDLPRAKPALLAGTGIVPGEIFNRAKVARALSRILDEWHARGYQAAEGLPLTKIDLDRHAIAITFEFKKGALARAPRQP
jgi:outer membrane protein insertion porin family